MEPAKADVEYATDALKACVDHGRTVMAHHLREVEAQGYDFSPEFQRMTTELFTLGVMWRFGERFSLPVNARDRAFACLALMLIQDGMSSRAAEGRVRMLSGASRVDGGKDDPVMRAGYEVGDKEGALVAIFDLGRNAPQLSGAPYRLIMRSRPVSGVLAVVGFTMSLVLGANLGQALVIAVILGAATLLTASLIYKQMVGRPPK